MESSTLNPAALPAPAPPAPTPAMLTTPAPSRVMSFPSSSPFIGSSTLEYQPQPELPSSGGGSGGTPSSIRRRRRRTSPHDQAILEMEYTKNDRPDKQRRQEIAKLVQMGEKEVQIWFCNKRQALRRRATPLQPHELIPRKASHPPSALSSQRDESPINLTSSRATQTGFPPSSPTYHRGASKDKSEDLIIFSSSPTAAVHPGLFRRRSPAGPIGNEARSNDISGNEISSLDGDGGENAGACAGSVEGDETNKRDRHQQQQPIESSHTSTSATLSSSSRQNSRTISPRSSPPRVRERDLSPSPPARRVADQPTLAASRVASSSSVPTTATQQSADNHHLSPFMTPAKPTAMTTASHHRLQDVLSAPPISPLTTIPPTPPPAPSSNPQLPTPQTTAPMRAARPTLTNLGPPVPTPGLLKRTSSKIRLSHDLDGKAALIILDSDEPEPPSSSNLNDHDHPFSSPEQSQPSIASQPTPCTRRSKPLLAADLPPIPNALFEFIASNQATLHSGSRYVAPIHPDEAAQAIRLIRTKSFTSRGSAHTPVSGREIAMKMYGKSKYEEVKVGKLDKVPGLRRTMSAPEVAAMKRREKEVEREKRKKELVKMALETVGSNPVQTVSSMAAAMPAPTNKKKRKSAAKSGSNGDFAIFEETGEGAPMPTPTKTPGAKRKAAARAEEVPIDPALAAHDLNKGRKRRRVLIDRRDQDQHIATTPAEVNVLAYTARLHLEAHLNKTSGSYSAPMQTSKPLIDFSGSSSDVDEEEVIVEEDSYVNVGPPAGGQDGGFLGVGSGARAAGQKTSFERRSSVVGNRSGKGESPRKMAEMECVENLLSLKGAWR